VSRPEPIQRSRDENCHPVTKQYETPRTGKSVLAVITSIGPLVLAFTLIALLPLGWSLLLIPIAALLMVRTFVLMHDCCHGSLFRSRRANAIVGFVAGVLTLTPFAQWRRDHAIHHASSGSLEHRGIGDIRTMTVNEYRSSSRWSRLHYRLYRHPLVLLGVGPAWLLIKQRWHTAKTAGRREITNVHATNLALILLVISLTVALGPAKLFAVYLPTVLLAAAIGIWLFYVQHQYERTYWASRPAWQYREAALAGSSWLHLPRPLDWVTGSIGYHHIHHLSPRIPHYNLRRCHNETPQLGAPHRLSLVESLRTFSLKLWDEERQMLVGWNALRDRKRH
jgi:omega-6 fatty acid desaturase (delta-12 desaturase)